MQAPRRWLEGNPARLPLMLLIGQSFFAGFAGALLYSASNSLFLVDHGSSRLAYVYLAIAVVVSSVSFGFTVLQARWPLSWVATLTSGAFVLVFVAFALTLTWTNWLWLSFALMVLFVLLVQLLGVVIGAQAGRLFDVGSLKTMYPLVLAGQVAGVIAGGIGTAPLVALFDDVKPLLYVCAVSMLVSWVVLTITIRLYPTDLANIPARTRRGARFTLSRVLLKRFVLTIFIYQMLSAMGTKLVDFIFLDRTEHVIRNASELAGFFGLLMAISTIGALLFLALVAGRLFARFGVGMGLMLNPAAVAVITISAIVAGVLFGLDTRVFFAIAIIAAIADYILSIGMTDTAINTTYQALPVEDRAAVQAMVQGVGVPAAFGIAGLMLIVIDRVEGLGLIHVVLLTALVVLAWTLSGGYAYRQYTRELIDNLNRRILNESTISLNDASTLNALEEILANADERQARFALDLLQPHATLLEHWALKLLDSQNDSVVVEALGRIERHRLEGGRERALLLIRTRSNPSVVAAALRALGAIDPNVTRDLALAYVDDYEPRIREAALAVLIGYCGDDGESVARRLMDELLASPLPTDRELCARVAGHSAQAGYIAMIASLLRDPDINVRLAALGATLGRPDETLLDNVIATLADRHTRSLAMSVLERFDQGIVTRLKQRLEDYTGHDTDTTVRLIRCREPVMSTDVANLLYENVAHPDALVRTQVINTLVRCHIRPTDAQKGTLGESIDIELLEALHAARCLLDIGDTPACSVLLQTLVNTFERARNNLVRLVALSHQAPDMVIRAARNLVAGNRFEKALAVETFSITLDKDHQRLLFTLCADSPIDRLLPLFDDRIQIPSLSFEQRLECLITRRESTAWLRACAIHAARGTRNQGLLQAIGGYLQDDNKWIRESAAGVLGSPALAVSPSTSTTTTDSSPGTTIMLNTIEKVSVLKNSAIFADTPTYVLASIGDIAEEMLAPAGSTFIVKGVLESSMYVIVSGNARVHDEGKTIAILTAGDVIGEMAVLKGQERSTSVTAVDDMHLLIIEKDAFDEVMANRSEIAHAVIHMLCDRLHKTTSNLIKG